MEQARRYVVHGMVQGVGFRFFAHRLGRQLGLGGYVKNLHDGSVEVYAIGSPDLLAELKRRLEEGPRAGYVQRVEEVEAAVVERYRKRFTIEFGGFSLKETIGEQS